jgi:phosphopantothenoylcysteine decarboxylase / phosphopantothenate---cysteine ligase
LATIVLGVTGGIAAYKSAPLIRILSESGHSVRVVATRNALRFIGQTTLEALSGGSVSIVDSDLFTDVDQVKHISLAKNADLILIAPATASFIARLAAGLADDLLTSTVLAASCPVLLAPAMHTEMWLNEATTHNLETLSRRGIRIVEPGVGRLTGSDSGVGRLAEPEIIAAAAMNLLSQKIMQGKRVLVTAGGTREPIDDARYVGNYSSGKQGIAFAKAAYDLGAEVTLIAANLEIEAINGIELIAINTVADLSQALQSRIDRFDLLVMAAAVSDFSPSIHEGKIKRADKQVITLDLKANPDLLKDLVGRLRTSGSNAITIGFAAESSSNLEELAKKKLSEKGCDFILANDISAGKIFGSDETSLLMVGAGESVQLEGTKIDVARRVLEMMATKLGGL